MLPMGAPANPAMNAGLIPQQFQPGVAQAGGPLPAPALPQGPMPGDGPMPGAGPMPGMAPMPGEMSGQFPAASAIQLATHEAPQPQPDTRGSTPGLNSGFKSPFSAERQFQETRTTGGRSPINVHDSSGGAVNSGALAQAIRARGANLGAGRA